ncbi:MFS transporter [Solibacillus sp. CAU 1738]|uniref:MFS transporter n=1 Tax=Solibacillus sp. CAU 1738 TaxID=3140363 RepID=UPI00326137D4
MDHEVKLKKATYHLYTFLFSKMVSSIGANVYAFGMSMYILSMTGSSFSFATNLILSILPRTILAPIAGVLVDRLPRKLLVLGGQIGMALTISSLLLYTTLNDLTILAIYITTVFYNLFATFSGIAFSASVGNLVDQDRIQKAMSFNQLSMSIAGIGGPVVGGMLFGFVSMEIFLIINICALIITAALESTMNFKLFHVKKAVTEQKETMMSSIKEGINYLQGKPVLKSILWTALWLNLFFTCLSVGGGFVLLEKIKLLPEHIGFIEGAGAIGMLITSIYIASRSKIKFPLQFSKRGILGMSILIGAAAIPLLIALPYYGDFAYYLVLMFGFGTLGVLTNTPIGIMLQTEVDEHYRGRVFSIMEMMGTCMMPLGTIMYGVLFDYVPASALFLVSSACLIAITLITLRKSVLETAHPELKTQMMKETVEPAR